MRVLLIRFFVIMMKALILSIAVIFFFSCEVSADEIIEKSLQFHGVERFSNAEIQFNFRNKHYVMRHHNGNFLYQVNFYVDSNRFRDELSNRGFTRYINNKKVRLPDSLSSHYRQALNSVIYFASLPFRLEDSAVQAKLLEKVQIKSKSFYQVEVRFSKNKGGDDFDDRFIYYFDSEGYKLRYFSYYYHRNGGGMRFRSALNYKLVNGVIFIDYLNYKSETAGIKLEDMYKEFSQGKLKEVSKIILQSISLKLL